ncbi:MAG: transcriptional regulator [Actinobacteria bacterium]|nr:MAG: transcriptional regulator [Actinomycetota bacterium]
MRTDIVFTLSGPDRVGIVDEVTGALLAVGGNVGTSRMTRLGGEFAIIMLASIPGERVAELEASLEPLAQQDYAIGIRPLAGADEREHANWLPYRVEVSGADHEGIVHDIARGLSDMGITIESAETDAEPAPVSAVPLFTMNALVLVPPTLAEDEWTTAVVDAAARANVDVTIVAED